MESLNQWLEHKEKEFLNSPVDLLKRTTDALEQLLHNPKEYSIRVLAETAIRCNRALLNRLRNE